MQIALRLFCLRSHQILNCINLKVYHYNNPFLLTQPNLHLLFLVKKDVHTSLHHRRHGDVFHKISQIDCTDNRACYSQNRKDAELHEASNNSQHRELEEHNALKNGEYNLYQMQHCEQLILDNLLNTWLSYSIFQETLVHQQYLTAEYHVLEYSNNHNYYLQDGLTKTWFLQSYHFLQHKYQLRKQNSV